MERVMIEENEYFGLMMRVPSKNLIVLLEWLESYFLHAMGNVCTIFREAMFILSRPIHIQMYMVLSSNVLHAMYFMFYIYTCPTKKGPLYYMHSIKC